MKIKKCISTNERGSECVQFNCDCDLFFFFNKNLFVQAHVFLLLIACLVFTSINLFSRRGILFGEIKSCNIFVQKIKQGIYNSTTMYKHWYRKRHKSCPVTTFCGTKTVIPRTNSSETVI